MAGSKRLPRWVKIIILAVVSVAAVFFGGGGIVFSNMLHSDALMPQGPTPDYGVYVVSIGNDTITLTSAEEREDTTRPGIAGLSWDGGHGHIAQIVEQDGLDVTRLFVRTSGSLPTICPGALSRCEEVDIDSWVYETDPGDIPLAFAEVEFASSLGTLGAWQIDAGDGSVWAIHAHGWRAARREALRTLPVYHAAGITSLVIDYRNDETAPADPSGIYRFGRTEWQDVEGAVRYAMDHGAERVALIGYSTGAALHMAFLENSELAGTVTAAVFDSPNVDMAETVRHEASKRTIPGTPFPVPGSLTTAALLIADLRWDVGWGAINYVERADEILRAPTLVFHGIEDDRVPIEVSRRLRDRAPDRIRLVEVADGGHVTSWNVGPESYQAILGSFLDEVGLATSR